MNVHFENYDNSIIHIKSELLPSATLVHQALYSVQGEYFNSFDGDHYT